MLMIARGGCFFVTLQKKILYRSKDTRGRRPEKTLEQSQISINVFVHDDCLAALTT